MAKMEAKYQGSLFNIGIWCGIGEPGATLGPLPEIEFPTSESSTPASPSNKPPKPPALRPRPSSGTPVSSILTGPKRSTTKGRPVTVDENNGYDNDAHPAPGTRSVAHEHFARAPAPRIEPFESLPGRIADAPAARSAAHAHFAKGKGGADAGLDLDRSLMDDEDPPEDGTDATCPESCPPSPFSRMTAEDALALEVGHTAFEYLEECFHYTEVSVLDRDKFNAVPEIVKSDLTIRGHLGKGNFSDVFEVVCRASPAARTPPSSRRPSARMRRASISASITTATLAKPSCGERKLVLAMKCLRPGIRSDVDQFTIGAEDLVHETAILAALDHRHIIKLHGRASGDLADAFVLNDGYFILLDRLSETLHDRIGNWKLDPRIALGGPASQQLEVGRSVADALSYLHSKGIVFRDLKPDNVGFDAAGVLKLFDFGFAVGLPERDEGNPAGLLFDRCGTPRYMAPEVGLSLGYGPAADVYSYGVLLWEVCALDKPFAAVASSAEFERTVFVGGKRPEVEGRWPTALRELMARCWSASPSERPADWTTVKSSLSSLMVNGDGTTKSSTKTPVRSSLRPGVARRSTTEGSY